MPGKKKVSRVEKAPEKQLSVKRDDDSIFTRGKLKNGIGKEGGKGCTAGQENNERRDSGKETIMKNGRNDQIPRERVKRRRGPLNLETSGGGGACLNLWGNLTRHSSGT